MNLDDLNTFLAVAEEGSLLKAARRLDMSRSTLSRKLESFEEAVGVTLLRRTRAGVELTQAGELLAERGRPLIQETTTLLAQIRSAEIAHVAQIRVAMPLGVPVHVGPKLARIARRLFPDTTLVVHSAVDPVSLLASDADLAVHFGSHTPAGPWTSVQVYPFKTQLVASKKYLAKHGTPQTVEDLHHHTLLSWQGVHFDARRWPLAGGGHLHINPVMITTDIGILRRCAADHQGIALLPDGNIPDPACPNLVRVLGKEVTMNMGARLVVCDAVADTPHIKVIFKAMKAFIALEAKTYAWFGS